jgi:hypothetical protein
MRNVQSTCESMVGQASACLLLAFGNSTKLGSEADGCRGRTTRARHSEEQSDEESLRLLISIAEGFLALLGMTVMGGFF